MTSCSKSHLILLWALRYRHHFVGATDSSARPHHTLFEISRKRASRQVGFFAVFWTMHATGQVYFTHDGEAHIPRGMADPSPVSQSIVSPTVDKDIFWAIGLRPRAQSPSKNVGFNQKYFIVNTPTTNVSSLSFSHPPGISRWRRRRGWRRRRRAPSRPRSAAWRRGAPSTSTPRPPTAPAAPRRTPACRSSSCSRGTPGTVTKPQMSLTEWTGSVPLAELLEKRRSSKSR